MEENKSSVSSAFKDKIKAYLDELAEKDEIFGLNYENPAKSLDECCEFIIEQAFQAAQNGRKGMDDPEVYGLAIHYYDEAEIGEIKSHPCQVLVNENVPLSPEEIEEAKNKALERITQDEINKVKAAEKKKAEAAKKKAEEQKAKAEEMGELSLFEF